MENIKQKNPHPHAKQIKKYTDDTSLPVWHWDENLRNWEEVSPRSMISDSDSIFEVSAEEPVSAPRELYEIAIRDTIAAIESVNCSRDLDYALQSLKDACNPAAIAELLGELDQLRQGQAQPVIAPVAVPVAVPLTKEKRAAIFLFAWNLYHDSFPRDIKKRMSAVCNYVCSSTEAAHGIARR